MDISDHRGINETPKSDRNGRQGRCSGIDTSTSDAQKGCAGTTPDDEPSARDSEKPIATDGGRDALAPTDARLLAALVGDSTRLNEVIRVVEGHVGHEIDHDRVYRRAEALGDRGFISLERETGIYRVTPRGAAALAEELHFLASQTGQRVVAPDVEAEADKLPPRKTTLQGSRPADMPFGTPSGEEADR